MEEEERDYGMFDDDAEEVAPEEERKKRKRKKKVDREGSKKNKKAKGIRGKFVKIVIGGLVLCVAVGLFTVIGNNGNSLNSNNSISDKYFMGVYTPFGAEPATYQLDDYYIYSENGDNYLVRFEKGIDGAYSVMDNAVIEGIKSGDDGVTPLDGTQFLEDIVAASDIEGYSKGMSDEVDTYIIYADGTTIASKLADDSCLDKADGYEYGGQTYTNAEDYIEAVYSAKNQTNSK